MSTGWIKLHLSLINHPKFRKLSATGKGILVNIWILAAQNESCGEIDAEFLDPDYLFPLIGVRPAESDHAIQQLELIKRIGWLDKIDESTYIPHNWDVYQSLPKSSTERSRLHRQRKITYDATRCNEASVACNDAATDTVACNAPSYRIEERRGEEKRGEERECNRADSSESVAPPPPEPKQQKQEKKPHPSALGLCNHLLACIRAHTPDFVGPSEAAKKTWLRDMSRILEIDGRVDDTVGDVIRWAHESDFWRANILCPAKLRKQFDKLQIQMRAEEKKHAATLDVNPYPRYQTADEIMREIGIIPKREREACDA